MQLDFVDSSAKQHLERADLRLTLQAPPRTLRGSQLQSRKILAQDKHALVKAARKLRPHQTPDTRHQTPDTRHQTPDTRHQTPDTSTTLHISLRIALLTMVFASQNQCFRNSAYTP